MIHLFPRIKNKMLLMCACCIALAGGYVALNRSVNLLVLLLVLIFAIALIVVMQLITAFNVHNQLLARLYHQMDAEGFLRQYEPFLNSKVGFNLRLMVRLHVSNAYCALGRFKEASDLLNDITIEKQKKPENELLSRFAIVSNLCYIAQQEENLEAAQKYMDELLSLKAKLQSMQAAKPQKKRMVFNTELNEQIMKFMTTGKADIKALRALVQENTQELHKVTISLWIARAYLAENNRREAETLLERIVNLASHLYPGKVASQILESLPGNQD